MGDDERSILRSIVEEINRKFDKFLSDFNVFKSEHELRLQKMDIEISDLYQCNSSTKLDIMKCKEEEDAKIDAITEVTSNLIIEDEEKKGFINAIKKHWKAIVISLIISSILIWLVVLGVGTVIEKVPSDKIAEIIKLVTQNGK